MYTTKADDDDTTSIAGCIIGRRRLSPEARRSV